MYLFIVFSPLLSTIIISSTVISSGGDITNVTNIINRIINRYKFLKKNIIIINHVFNNRYGTSGLSTHNKETIEKCIILENLEDYKDEKLKILE